MTSASCAGLPSILLVRVVGSSMEPTLSDGDQLIALRSRRRPPRPGDVVLFPNNIDHDPPLHVKRIRHLQPAGLEGGPSAWVEGDALLSLGSTRLGAIPIAQLVGRVILIRHKGRWRRCPPLE